MRPSVRKRSLTSTRRLEQAAGIVAQIEDQAAQSLALQLLHGLAHLFARCLAEVDKPDVGDLVFFIEHEVPFLQLVGLAAVAQHALHVDVGASDFHFDRLLGAFVQHGQRHFWPGRPGSDRRPR